MNYRTVIKCASALAIVTLAGCGSGKKTDSVSEDPVAKLAGNMVPIPEKGFFISKYEVTQALWEAVMEENPSHFKGAELPVETVTRYDCLKFIMKLNALPAVMATGYEYRLPTRREWEYTACGGTDDEDKFRLADGTEIDIASAFRKGGHRFLEVVDELGWVKGNSGDRTHPVGQKKPNAFGLYDVLGNVWEWVDGREPMGGGWNLDAGFVGDDDDDQPDFCRDYVGFRLAADPRGKRNDSSEMREEKFTSKKNRQSESARIAAMRARVNGIKTAIETYEVINGGFPTSLDDLTVKNNDRPPLLDKAMLVDAWGNSFQYKRLSKYKFEIRSAGPDGQMGNEDDITN